MTQSSIEIWSRGQNDPLAIPDSVLYSRIADTIAWCSSILNDETLEASMRSLELYPQNLHDGRDDVVCDVGSTRHWQIRATTTGPLNAMPNLKGGRLLCYFPDADLCDGAAEQESDGFFDIHNTPPWDTWIGYFSDRSDSGGGYENYLLAYVPKQLLAVAAAGIRVNPEECIMWLDDTEVKIRSRVAQS